MNDGGAGRSGGVDLDDLQNRSKSAWKAAGAAEAEPPRGSRTVFAGRTDKPLSVNRTADLHDIEAGRERRRPLGTAASHPVKLETWLGTP